MMTGFWPYRHARRRLRVALLAVLMAVAGTIVLVPQPTAASTEVDQEVVEQAVNWMLDHQGSTAYEGLCEGAVENAFGTSGQYPTARANWNTRMDTDQAQTPYSEAPRGALVFYDTSPDGHVAISLGNGTMASTSVRGQIGVAPLSHFPNPLGWAYATWDNADTTLSSAPAKPAPPKPAEHPAR